MKICKKCNIQKSLDSFHNHKQMKDGKINTCKECSNKKNNDRYYTIKDTKEYKTQKVEGHLRRKYDLSLEQYNKLFNNQNGCCDICKTHQNDLKRVLDVDHDHITGLVRGLLCNDCNTSLGRLNDDINILENAKKYLIKHSNKLKAV